MPLVLLAAAVFVVGVSVLAMHNSVSNQSSKSAVSEALDDIEKSKEELDKKIKTQLFLGTVTIIAKIANWYAGREKAQREKINEIESASGATSAASTAAMMNIAQNIVAEVQNERAQVSETTAVSQSEGAYVETFPAAEQEGPKIYDTPAVEQQGPNVLVFPKVEQEPSILVFADDNPAKPQIESFPVERPKALGDSILWSSGYQGAGKADSLKLEDFTKELLENKPKYARDVKKWYNKSGKISIDENGVWTYHDWEGNSVSYPDGYPDFKTAGMVQQEVPIGEFKGYDKDFAKADELAPNGPKADENTWHHHQDGTTMQEIDKVLHKRFTHIGGMSGVKK